MNKTGWYMINMCIFAKWFVIRIHIILLKDWRLNGYNRLRLFDAN